MVIAGFFFPMQSLLQAMDEKPSLAITSPHSNCLLPPKPCNFDDGDDVVCENEIIKFKQQYHKRVMNLCINARSENWSQSDRMQARILIGIPLLDPNFIARGYSFLIAACTNADTFLVCTLLEQDADPNIQVNNRNPLGTVIESKTSFLQNQIECIDSLTKYGACPVHITKSGFTYLHTAAESKPALLIPLLQIKSLGNFINKQTFKNQETPLITLIQHGWNKSPNNECLRKALTSLLEHNADPAIEDSSGHSSYYYAEHHINPNIAEWLKQYSDKELSKNY
jgi:ankyrin repeat protein